MNAQERLILKPTCIHVHICRDKAALSRVKHGLSFIKTVCTKNIALPCPVRLLPYTINLCQFMAMSLCTQERYCHTFPKNRSFKYQYHTICPLHTYCTFVSKFNSKIQQKISAKMQKFGCGNKVQNVCNNSDVKYNTFVEKNAKCNNYDGQRAKMH